MDNKSLRMPFSTFDFFGYVIPGTILLLGLYVHDNVLLNGSGPFLRLGVAIVSKPKELFTPYLFPLVLFVGMMVVYIMGHVVSALSSALMDRMVMDRVNFYPYVKLLHGLFTLEAKELFKRRCGKTALLVLLIGSVIVAIWGPSKWVLSIGVFVLILLWAFKEVVNTRFKKPSRTPLISGDGSFKRRWGWLNSFGWRMRVVLATFFLLNEITIVIEKVCRATFGLVLSSLRIGHAFPKPFIKLFRDKFKKVYGMDPNGFQTSVFWLSATYIVHHLPSNAALAQRAYNFYTLMRNLAMTCFLLFWYGVAMHFSEAGATAVGSPCAQAQTRYYAWILVTVVFTAILALRYYNTYYNHYTKLVLRSFVTPEKSSDAE